MKKLLLTLILLFATTTALAEKKIDLQKSPVIKAQTVETVESKEISFTLEATDKENDVLSFQITKQSSHGTLTGTNFSGQDSFSVKANDTKDDSDIVTIMIEVKTEVINGHRLPPEPDETLNNSTLLGIDSNGNGVRDDVERWIYHTYTHPIKIGIFMQRARAYQKVVVDPSRAKETVKYSDNALSCEVYWIYKSIPRPFDKYEHFNDRKKIKKIQFNTLKRHMKFKRYNAEFSGEVLRAPKASKEKCEFDDNGILEAIK